MPYAQAIASSAAAINRCPPGGQAGIIKLAALTGLPVVPLDPAYGFEQTRRVAWIDSQWCIGCTLCIQACPVDAIIGAAKAMHAVIPLLCTGCDLCVAPCPVDCIQMQRLTPESEWSTDERQSAKMRYQVRQDRLVSAPERQRESARRQLVDSAIQKARAKLAHIKRRP